MSLPDSVFVVVQMRFIDSTLRFAHSYQRVCPEKAPLHLHLASSAIQQMALEELKASQ